MISLIPLIEKRGLLIAGGFALIAAILAAVWLNNEKLRLDREARDRLASFQESTVDVVFAKIDIPRGKVITEDMLETKFVAKNNLPAEAVTSVARVAGRISNVNIQKDKMILVGALVWPTTKDTTLTTKTPIGKRAMTISVDNISALLGMINPGDYVDVISLILLPVNIDGKESGQPATVPLFQNVLVLAVGSDLGASYEKEPDSRRRAAAKETIRDSAALITLALSPEEANILAFVQEQGKIRLVLRSQGDAKTNPVQPASWETLLKYLFPDINLNVKEEKPPEIKKDVPQVEIIRGFNKEMMAISQGK